MKELEEGQIKSDAFFGLWLNLGSKKLRNKAPFELIKVRIKVTASISV